MSRSKSNKSCPICREEANNDEAWVMSDAPNNLQMSEELCSSLMGIVEKHPGGEEDTEDSE